MKTETEPKRKKRMIILPIILALLLFQLGASFIQSSRYHFQDEGYDDYACVQMSRDCEKFFESASIRVYQMQGYRETGERTETGGYETKGHRWILLDLGFTQIHYECTSLTLWNPMWEGYTINVLISDGYVIDGEHFDNESRLRWRFYE